MILLMVSDHSAQEDSLLRSEVLAMTSFMRWKLKKLSRESSLLFPVSQSPMHYCLNTVPSPCPSLLISAC